MVKKNTEETKKSVYVFPYDQRSRTAQILARDLKAKIGLPHVFSKEPTDELVDKDVLLINWGANNFPTRITANAKSVTVINDPQATRMVSDRIRLYKKVKKITSVPDYTESLSKAIAWHEAGKLVLGRTKVSEDGRDIVLHDDDFSKFSTSNYWTRYYNKGWELRAHIAFGEIVGYEHKAQVAGTDTEGNNTGMNPLVWNLFNSFSWEETEIRKALKAMYDKQALRIMKELDLEVGALDFMYVPAVSKSDMPMMFLDATPNPYVPVSFLDGYIEQIRKNCNV